MKIVLVRHGYSEANKSGLYSGWLDVDLAQEGIEELNFFKEHYNYPKTDRYYSSDLMRATKTFDILFGDSAKLFEASKDLREIYYGELEGEVWGKMPNFSFNEHFFKNERVYEGEIVSEFSFRLYKKLQKILRSLQKGNEDSATIICHAGVIKMILIMLEKRPFSDFSRLNAPNGLGYVLDLDIDEDDRIILNSVDEIKKLG